MSYRSCLKHIIIIIIIIKDRTNIITTNFSKQTAKNFITVLWRHTPLWKIHQTKRELRTSGGKYIRNKLCTKACWIKDQDQPHPNMEWKQLSKQDVADALRTTLNWKAPGREQIPNFWLKQLIATHKYMAVIFNKLIETGPLPEWLMQQ